MDKQINKETAIELLIHLEIQNSAIRKIIQNI